MITLAVALAEAYSTNPEFNPVDLYVGTVIVDVCILLTITTIFGN